jgi:glutaredoxin
MEKIIIYTNEVCPYCKQIKEKLTENNIEFENKFTKDFTKEWEGIVGLTGMAQVPTIFYKNNYFQPQRDFGNPQGLISLLENFKESEFSESRQALERTKTLNYNMIMAFNRMDGILRQIETKLNTEENVDESTD